MHRFDFDVFLSHNNADKPRVRRLAELLRDAGLRVWFDEWCVKSGDIIALKVEDGLDRSRVLLLCISPAAIQSGWVGLERSTAIHRDPTNAGRRFVPVLLGHCSLPDSLAKYKYVDARDDESCTLKEILAVCRPEVDEKLTTLEGKCTLNGKELEPQEIAVPLAVMDRQLVGHKGWIHSVTVSPDGTWAASGSEDKTIKIWDLENGVCLATLKGHREKVTAIAITADGKQILSAGDDGHLFFWDSHSREKIDSKYFGSRISGLAIAAIANKVICAGLNSVLLLDMTGVAPPLRLQDDSYVSAVAISDNAKRLVSSSERAIRLWDLETGECTTVMKGHYRDVVSLDMTPDGKFAVSGSEDTTVKIWDLTTGRCVGTLEGHQSSVHSVAISPDGTLIASAGFTDETVRLWGWESGTCLQIISKFSWKPISVSFSRDGLRLMVGSAHKVVSVYRLAVHRQQPFVEQARRYVNAKVVLLGEGTVGKTSLAHRLIDDEYVIMDRTHGMNVWRLELMPDSFRPTKPQIPELHDREALLWDLAGQEDYRLIHQLFLEETALALLLVNPQKEDPFAESEHWLKALQTAVSGRIPTQLLIFSQTDVGGIKLGAAKIDRFCAQYGIADWVATSAKTGKNCSDRENGEKPSKLKQLIAHHIPWDKLPWTATPRLLAKLKNSVMEMRDDNDIRLIRFAELAQRLAQALPEEKLLESNVRTAVTLLANHGLVLPLKFGDLVLLRPDLLNGYAGAIIRSARAHTDEIGSVAEADVYSDDFDFTGVERLVHRPDEKLLLRAVVQTFLDHSLCIAEETPKGRQLVFPSQYRRARDLPRHPDIFVSYTFCGEWQSVWTTLVVRLWYSQEFERRELWRNAAEFASPKGHALGLKLTRKQGAGEATISLYFDKEVQDELKALFIEYVHRHLARYACEVVRDRRYVCKCGNPVKDLDTVRERLEAKKDFIVCQRCDERVPLQDFIEQRLKSDPIAQQILAMDEAATRSLSSQALEQILIGHMFAICGEANQIFRPISMFDYGIDGEVEFRDNNGKESGRKIYVQLKSGNSYLRTRRDGREVFDVQNQRHLEYWVRYNLFKHRREGRI